MTNKNLIDVIPVELLNKLDKIEVDYKKNKKIQIALFCFVVLIGAILGIFSFIYFPDAFFIVVVVTFIAAAFSLSFGNSRMEIDFKYQIIQVLFPNYFNIFKGAYDAKGFLIEKELRDSGAIKIGTKIDE